MLLWLCIACVPKHLIGPTLLAGSTRNAQAAPDSRCRRGAQRSAGTRHTAGQHWAAGCRRPRAGGRLAGLEGGHGALWYMEMDRAADDLVRACSVPSHTLGVGERILRNAMQAMLRA